MHCIIHYPGEAVFRWPWEISKFRTNFGQLSNNSRTKLARFIRPTTAPSPGLRRAAARSCFFRRCPAAGPPPRTFLKRCAQGMVCAPANAIFVAMAGATNLAAPPPAPQGSRHRPSIMALGSACGARGGEQERRPIKKEYAGKSIRSIPAILCNFSPLTPTTRQLSSITPGAKAALKQGVGSTPWLKRHL